MEGQTDTVHFLATMKENKNSFFETAPICIAACSSGHSSSIAEKKVVLRRVLLGRSVAHVTLENNTQHHVSSISTDSCVKFILIQGTPREFLQCQIQYSAI